MKLYDIKNILDYPVWINENDTAFTVTSAADLMEQANNADVVYITSDGEGMVTIETSTLPEWKICFIDGHDMIYKESFQRGATVEQAIENLYIDYGWSFDHSITSVTRVDAQLTQEGR